MRTPTCSPTQLTRGHFAIEVEGEVEMSELARNLAVRLRAFLGDRRRAPRFRARLSFTVSVVGLKTLSNGAQRPRAIEGHTLDVSATGLALIVPAIRVGEHYLAGENRRLDLSLALPGGMIAMQVTAVRYESLEDGMDTGYLIGVQVEQITEPDRELYVEYINGLTQR